MPYEYQFSPLGADKLYGLEKVRPFINDFIKATEHAGIANIVALRLFPGRGYKGGLEDTQGRAMINFLPGQVGQESNPLIAGPANMNC